jgi:hypothetical protein
MIITMRKACTRNQDKLFDDIFGPEKPKFEINDCCMVRSGNQ